MKFRAKRDRTFIYLIIFSTILLAAATLWPVVYEIFYAAKTEWIAVFVMIFLFITFITFILWISFDIEYAFFDQYLYVRGGPFRSRIPYNQMTRVFETTNILVGYRILSSKDALEIQYNTGLLGSIIISPDNKELFMEELHKRRK